MKKMILMLALMSAFTQLSAKNYIRLIRNATLKMEYAGKQILVDPFAWCQRLFRVGSWRKIQILV